MLKNNKGFSLVELMVVVAIIGVLAAIGIPQISKYMARARQAEAKSNLASVYTANKAFFAEYGIYDNRFSLIGFRPEGKLRYNIGWADAGTRCDLAAAGYTAPLPGGVVGSAVNADELCGDNGTMTNGCSLLQNGLGVAIAGSGLNCTADGARTFTAGAAGRIGSATAVDQWTINQQKNLINRRDGTN